MSRDGHTPSSRLETTTLVVHLPEELSRRVEEVAAQRGVSPEQVAVEAIEDRLGAPFDDPRARYWAYAVASGLVAFVLLRLRYGAGPALVGLASVLLLCVGLQVVAQRDSALEPSEALDRLRETGGRRFTAVLRRYEIAIAAVAVIVLATKLSGGTFVGPRSSPASSPSTQPGSTTK